MPRDGKSDSASAWVGCRLVACTAASACREAISFARKCGAPSSVTAAGCVVARRLVEANATVLLLEAGGSDEGVRSISNPPQWPVNLGSTYDWGYRYEPSPHVAGRSIPLPLGKGLGGAGGINGLIWGRGHPGG